MKQFIAAGDLNSDRRADIVTVDSSGVLWLYPGKGSFLLGARSKLGSGWSSYAIFSTGDFNGDTRADLIARDSSGNLWLYPGNGRGGLNPRTQIGKGWSIFNAIIGPGDWNYDGNTDLMARDRATGYLYLYPGKGNGSLLRPQVPRQGLELAHRVRDAGALRRPQRPVRPHHHRACSSTTTASATA